MAGLSICRLKPSVRALWEGQVESSIPQFQSRQWRTRHGPTVSSQLNIKYSHAVPGPGSLLLSLGHPVAKRMGNYHPSPHFQVINSNNFLSVGSLLLSSLKCVLFKVWIISLSSGRQRHQSRREEKGHGRGTEHTASFSPIPSRTLLPVGTSHAATF